MGPTYSFNVNKLDFGLIPYGFRQEKKVELVNTSVIVMSYNLRIATASETVRQMIKMEPMRGTLQPNKTQVITVSITPTTIQSLNIEVLMDICGAQTNLSAFPISADPVAPRVCGIVLLFQYRHFYIVLDSNKDSGVGLRRMLSSVSIRNHVGTCKRYRFSCEILPTDSRRNSSLRLHILGCNE
jgi:hypothetical protein